MVGHEEHEPLTPTEQRVQELVRAGLSNKQIADKLGISRDAVRYHLKSLHAKLDTDSDRTQLRRRGWLPLAVAVPAMKAAGAVVVFGGLSWLTAAAYLSAQEPPETPPATQEYCYAEVAPGEIVYDDCDAAVEKPAAAPRSQVTRLYCFRSDQAGTLECSNSVDEIRDAFRDQLESELVERRDARLR